MPNLKGVVLLLIIAIFALGVSARADVSESPNDDLRLWYDEAATIWEEYLPLGNGRLGMMPSGALLPIISSSTRVLCGRDRCSTPTTTRPTSTEMRSFATSFVRRLTALFPTA